MRLTTIVLALQSIGLISARAIKNPGLRVETLIMALLSTWSPH